MDLGLKNKVIVVSGGARGIGRSICERLANENAIPVVLDRVSADECRLVEEFTAEHRPAGWFQVELTEEAVVAETVNRILTQFGRIDGVVNNAAVNDLVDIDSAVSQFRASLERNLVQCYSLVHFALPALRKNGGAIVNIGSKIAFAGQGRTSGYAAAKGGLNALTREWALALAPDNIRVNAIIPAEVWTPQYEEWLSGLENADKRREEIEACIPLGHRMTEPSEIADVTAFLLSSCAGHITGQWIHVDGGYVHLDRAWK